MARLLAVFCIVAALASGCLGDDDGGGEAPTGEGGSDGSLPGSGPTQDGGRVSVGGGPTDLWLATGCTAQLFEVRMPAELVRPHLPERFELYEFPPGVSYVGTYVFSCAGAAIGNASAPDGLRQALLSIVYLPPSGRAYFVLDWVVSDAGAQAALAGQGFTVAAGDVTSEAGSPARVRIAGAQEKATITWLGEPDDAAPSPATMRFVQDAAGTDLTFEASMPGSFTSEGFTDGCLIEPLDPVYQSVLKSARDCSPYLAPDGDVTFRLQGTPSPDASR